MKILNVINSFVFLFATATIMSIFYEGVVLKWYAFVPVLMIVTDVSFIVATILNILFNRKIKILFFFNIFSTFIICIAIIMKILNILYPQWSLVFWNFYIAYFYGTQVIICIYKYVYLRNNG
ncbi:MAG: hypothetical protein FWF51_11950 [Chitinivibrionia bacterium]|nr:hypothetical protein [Chitinivibrionia bacterium]